MDFFLYLLQTDSAEIFFLGAKAPKVMTLAKELSYNNVAPLITEPKNNNKLTNYCSEKWY